MHEAFVIGVVPLAFKRPISELTGMLFFNVDALEVVFH
jgi:hypothetical protein